MIIDEINTETKHIKELVKDLRKEDLAEIKAKAGDVDVEETLLKGFALTNYCRSFFVNKKIAGIYGVVPSEDKNIGSPFLLCTPKVKKYCFRRATCRTSKIFFFKICCFTFNPIIIK